MNTYIYDAKFQCEQEDDVKVVALSNLELGEEVVDEEVQQIVVVMVKESFGVKMNNVAKDKIIEVVVEDINFVV